MAVKAFVPEFKLASVVLHYSYDILSGLLSRTIRARPIPSVIIFQNLHCEEHYILRLGIITYSRVTRILNEIRISLEKILEKSVENIHLLFKYGASTLLLLHRSQFFKTKNIPYPQRLRWEINFLTHPVMLT